jgi:hypothetical protein
LRAALKLVVRSDAVADNGYGRVTGHRKSKLLARNSLGVLVSATVVELVLQSHVLRLEHENGPIQIGRLLRHSLGFHRLLPGRIQRVPNQWNGKRNQESSGERGRASSNASHCLAARRLSANLAAQRLPARTRSIAKST